MWRGICFAFGLLMATAASGQGFQLVIPTGPSWQDIYRDNPVCQSFLGDDPLSIFGIDAVHAGPTSPGLTVRSVAPESPAAGLVRPNDLLVARNSDPFVLTRLSGNLLNEGIWDGYNYARGVYLFGYRDSQLVEFVLYPCGQTEPVFPFRSTQYFGSLYDAVTVRNDSPLPFLLAGLVRGKNAASGPSVGGRVNDYMIFQTFCWVRATTDLEVTRTIGEAAADGSIPNGREETYGYAVERGLYGAISRDFELTHNVDRVHTRYIEATVIRLIDRIGCATPEWKGLEQLLYEAVGLNWNNAPYRMIDWDARGLPPPQ